MKPALIFAFLFVAVAAGQDSGLKVNFTQFTLPNGLTVILHEDHSVPIVSVNTWYHVGSSRETPGRTGFAHLFEHLMFEGSAHVPEGMFDNWLESAGGDNNGSTMEDRTNYWENVPANAVDLPLFLESDRMGYLLDVVSPELVDGQRDVVKNERRQSYENQPYGKAWLHMPGLVWPEGHPYSWPVIGSMADLSAASLEDVTGFFRKYYGPNNASLVVAGDIDIAETRKKVEHWFSDIPAGPTVEPLKLELPRIQGEQRVVLEDKVQLPRLYMAWITPPFFKPGDAEMDVISQVLTGGKNARLYKRLVYDLQIAQSVSAFQESMQHGSVFYLIVTARSGHTLTEMETLVLEELDRLKTEAPTRREVERALNQRKAGFLRGLEQIGGFGGKADQLNQYFFYTGDPGYFEQDLERYEAVTPASLSEHAARWLPNDGRVILSIVPEGRTDLAAAGKGGE